MFNVEKQQQFGSLLSHSHYQNNIVSAAAARQPWYVLLSSTAFATAAHSVSSSARRDTLAAFFLRDPCTGRFRGVPMGAGYSELSELYCTLRNC